MAKAKSSKNTDKKKKKQTFEKKLKNLKPDQNHKPVPADKSLRSLKKIQHQLDDIIVQRSKEKKQIKALKETSKTLSRQLHDTESHFPKLALNKDLKKLKNNLRGQNAQFLTTTDKLSQEIALFKNLTERVTRKINTLEKASEPTNLQIHNLTQDHARLFKKISAFEDQLAQFNGRFEQPERAITDFTQQLNELGQFVAEINQTSQEQDSLIKLLQADTSNIRKSLQQIQSIDNKTAELIPKLANLENQNQQLSSQTGQLEKKLSAYEETQQQRITPLEDNFKELEQSLQSLQADNKEQQTLDNNALAQLINQVNQFDEQLQHAQEGLKQYTREVLDSEHESSSEQIKQVFSQIHFNYQEQDTQIKLLQADTQNIRKSLLRIQGIDDKIVSLIPKLEDIEEQNQRLTRRTDQLDKKLTALEVAQQQLTRPLETHLQELEQNLQSLHQDYTEQQQTLSGETEKLTLLNNRIDQFDDLLQQSQDELQQHIQLLLKSENNNSQQFNLISSKLAPISQQLANVVEQSTTLKAHFNGLQAQQDNALEQLTSGQYHLAELDKTLQENITALARKLARSNNQYQKNINQLENTQLEQQSEQKEQLSHLNQLGKQIRTRSQLFAVGLIAVLAISALLLFTQEMPQGDTDKKALINEIKSDINNETYSKINALTKQNSLILNKQLGQIRDSIQQVKQEKGQNLHIEVQALENDWQNKHQLLQADIAKTQTQQQVLQQSVSKLSVTVNTLGDEIKERQKTVLANRSPSSKETEIPSINKITTPFYGIQLLGVLRKESINHFIAAHNLSGDIRAYKTELRGQPWYILIHGNYTRFSQAKEQIKQLPENLLKQSPWVRKLP